MLVCSSYNFSCEFACNYCDLRMLVYGSYNFSPGFAYNCGDFSLGLASSFVGFDTKLVVSYIGIAV